MSHAKLFRVTPVASGVVKLEQMVHSGKSSALQRRAWPYPDSTLQTSLFLGRIRDGKVTVHQRLPELLAKGALETELAGDKVLARDNPIGSVPYRVNRVLLRADQLPVGTQVPAFIDRVGDMIVVAKNIVRPLRGSGPDFYLDTGRPVT